MMRARTLFDRKRRMGVHGTLLVAVVGMALAGCGGKDQGGHDAAAGKAEPSSREAAAGADAAKKAGGMSPARQVLEAMAQAYRQAKTYSDHATVVFDAQINDDKIHQEYSFSVAMVRPNRLRLEVNKQVVVVCDGDKFQATIKSLKSQVLSKPAPADLTLKTLMSDPVLGQELGNTMVGLPVQLVLLLDDKAVSIILEGAEEPTLLTPDTLNERLCDRVEIKRAEGRSVIWIDRKTRELRRMEYPVDELRQSLASNGKVGALSVTGQFARAELGGPIEPAAFRFEVPRDAELVDFFRPPDTGELLGKKSPGFRFVDLNGDAVTLEKLAGKVVVLDFWATWCEPCRKSLPVLAAEAAKYKDHPKVAFYAVSIDGKDVENKKLTEMLQSLKVDLPVVRDQDEIHNPLFMVLSIPTTIFLGPDGVVQDFQVGMLTDGPAEVGGRIEKLLAGKDLFPEARRAYEERLRRFKETATNPHDAPTDDAGGQLQPVPKPEIAQKSTPQVLKLKSLWKCTSLKGPGNLLVVPQGPAPQIYVIDEYKSVVELAAADGKVKATHDLDLPKEEAASFLRTATDGKGARYFALSGSSMQQVHLYDGGWKSLLHFPKDAHEHRHAGIADVQFGDLEGDGTPLMYLGYWETVGVQCVSLEGKLRWANQSVEYAMRVAVTGPDRDGHKSLLAVNGRSGAAALLDNQGERRGEVSVRQWPLRWIVAASLDGQPTPQYCGLSARRVGSDIRDVAVGFDLQGKELWNYELPRGIQDQLVELIVPGRVLAEGPEHWILPGPDGSIHFVDQQGKPLDKFNYGAALRGLGVCQIAGKPVLLVATAEGVEALEIAR